jgi:hypothetical protein
MKINRSKLQEMIREAINEVINENAPAPSKPQSTPTPGVKDPSIKPDEKKPRRPLGNPNVKPAPKAKLNESEKEILAKIINRYKNAKK